MPRWQPGQSGNPNGRPKGSLNHATVDVRALSRRLLLDREYLTRIHKRLIAGTLAPGLEVTLWSYAFGRPTERVEVTQMTELPPLTIRIEDATPSAD